MMAESSPERIVADLGQDRKCPRAPIGPAAPGTLSPTRPAGATPRRGGRFIRGGASSVAGAIALVLRDAPGGALQRLSCLSSGLPFPFISEHGVEGCEDLAGDGDE